MWNDRLVELQALVGKAQAAFQAHEAAKSEEHEARRRVLEQLVPLLTPVLPALVADLQVGLMRLAGDTSGVTEDRADIASENGVRLRALHLAGDRSARKDLQASEAGQYVGSSLVLLEDGRLAELRYQGTWKKASPRTPPGEQLAYWAAELRVVDAAHAARAWRLDDILTGLQKALTFHNTNRVKAAGATKTRAMRTEDLAKLLEEMVRRLKEAT